MGGAQSLGFGRDGAQRKVFEQMPESNAYQNGLRMKWKVYSP